MMVWNRKGYFCVLECCQVFVFVNGYQMSTITDYEQMFPFLNIKSKDGNGAVLPMATWDEADCRERLERYRRVAFFNISHGATGLTPFTDTRNQTRKDKTRGINPESRLRTFTVSYYHPEGGDLITDVWDLDYLPEALSYADFYAPFFGEGKTLMVEDAQNLLAWVYFAEVGVYTPMELSNGGVKDDLLSRTAKKLGHTKILDLRMMSRVHCYDLNYRYRSDKDIFYKPYLFDKVLASRGPKEAVADENCLADYMALSPLIGEEVAHSVQDFRRNNAKMGRLLETIQPLKPGVRRYLDLMNRCQMAYAAALLSGKEVGIPDLNAEWNEGRFLEVVGHGLETAHSFYARYGEGTVKTLARIHAKGLCMDVGKAHRLADKLQADSETLLTETAERLRLSELKEKGYMLLDRSVGNSDIVNEFWHALFLKVRPDAKFNMGKDGRPKFGSKELVQAGLDKGVTEPLYRLVSTIQSGKTVIKTLHSLETYANREEGVDVLHPFLSVSASTDRLSAQQPTTQNFPRLPAFRSTLDAGLNKVTVSADYSQMELRIAAALAIRSQQEAFSQLQQELSRKGSSPVIAQSRGLERAMWVSLLKIFAIRDKEALHRGIEKYQAESDTLRRCLLDCIRSFGEEGAVYDFSRAAKTYGAPIGSYQDLRDACDLTEMKVYAATLRLAQMETNKRYISKLRDVFAHGLDPHLITGVSMKTGDLSSFEYLNENRHLSKEIRMQYADARNAAKAVNFGLIYGMNEESLYSSGVSSYGLDWTLDDAAKARRQFFQLYPELGFCQKLEILRPHVLYDAHIAKGMDESRRLEQGVLRHYQVSSLTGRKYSVFTIQDALNYRNQGTGAHIIQDAMNRLPEQTLSLVCNQIHDELVAEVPLGLEAEIGESLRACMIRAAEDVLAPYGVPVEVEIEIGDDWGVDTVSKKYREPEMFCDTVSPI